MSALDKSVTEILEVTFGEQLRDVSFLGNVANKVKRIAYQAILGSVTRMGSEIISNMSMIVADPKAAAKGFSEFSKLSFLSRKEGTDILNNLGSRMTTRLFDTKSLSSRFADMTGFFQSTPSEGTARGRVANIMGIIMRMGVKQTAAAVDKIAGTIISSISDSSSSVSVPKSSSSKAWLRAAYSIGYIVIRIPTPANIPNACVLDISPRLCNAPTANLAVAYSNRLKLAINLFAAL